MAKTTKGAMGAACGADLEEYLALVRAFPLVHIRDEIIDRSIGAADFPCQLARLQPREAARMDASFRGQDQLVPEF